MDNIIVVEIICDNIKYFSTCISYVCIHEKLHVYIHIYIDIKIILVSWVPFIK